MGRDWDSDKDMPDLTGKVAIVTGGNTGIGREVVRQLAIHNAKVYMASRTESRALAAIQEIEKEHPELAQKAGIVFLPLDLNSLKAARNAAQLFLEKETRLDILVNNAGIMAAPYKLTEDGIEVQFQSNHLGHFAFTIPLLPLLVQTSKEPNTSVRIVQTASVGHNRAASNVKFDSIESVNREFGMPLNRYGQSKLANILFAKEIARRYSNERIFSSAVHPGIVQTELTRSTYESYPWLKFVLSPVSWFFKTPYQGALTTLYCATAPELEEKNLRGEYFIPTAKLAEPSKLAQNDQLAQDLWTLSEKIVQEKLGDAA